MSLKKKPDGYSKKEGQLYVDDAFGQLWFGRSRFGERRSWKQKFHAYYHPAILLLASNSFLKYVYEIDFKR